MTTEEYLVRLNEITERKYSIVEELLVLSKKQAEHIKSKDIDKLNIIIELKQKLIDKTDKLDEQFDGQFVRLKMALGVKSLEDISDIPSNEAKRLKGSVQKILSLINEIVQLEKLNNNDANAVLKEFGSSVKQINSGKKVV